jgi:hypothetical protein
MHFDSEGSHNGPAFWAQPAPRHFSYKFQSKVALLMPLVTCEHAFRLRRLAAKHFFCKFLSKVALLMTLVTCGHAFVRNINALLLLDPTWSQSQCCAFATVPRVTSKGWTPPAVLFCSGWTIPGPVHGFLEVPRHRELLASGVRWPGAGRHYRRSSFRRHA